MKVATALVMQERAGFDRPSTLLRNKGSFTNPGERVYAAVPAVFGSLSDGEPENRLGLARWLVSDDNPLTARVTVNRLWETLFGRGLVATVEDFGTQGEPPSHPELLDWLAVEFMERGWSQKAILREIVSSATYRQSSAASAALRERDPDNRLLARGARYRLEAEMVRDVALAASGLLSPKLGGPSVYPPQPEGVWNVPYSQMKWETSSGRGPQPQEPLHLLPPQLAVPEPDRLRRAEPRAVHGAPRAHQHAAAGAHDAQRPGVRGGRPRPGAADGERRRERRSPRGSRSGTGCARRAVPRRRTSRRSRRSTRARRRACAGDPAAADAAALTTVASVLLNLDATLTRE